VKGARVQTDRLTPQQIRQVLQMRFGGDIHTNLRVIAGKLGVSHAAVIDCLARAEAASLLWPLSAAALTDEALERLLSPPHRVAL
jgi:hypothetical protein